ncbi:MAG: hypothetical protein KA004_02905 [Verrucomicrobiales bacterium]|nr:hypothetical protein [Verrucomicrobiales bacterium]
MPDAVSTTTAPALPPPSGVPMLTFNWKRREIRRVRLFGFLLVSLLGHAVCFYLFKVVTPGSTRRLPPEESVLFLESSQPGVAEILTSLEDHSTAALIPLDQTDSGTGEISQFIPPYQPTYAGYQPEVQEPPSQGEMALPELAAASIPLLPVVEGLRPIKPAPAAPAAPPVPQLLVKFPLSSRALQSPPQWPQNLTPPEEPDAVFTFHLGVDQAGIVRHCFAEGAASPPDLRGTLSRLRFQPSTHPGLQWAEVEIHW